jgi:hypothetical protein
MNQFHSFEAVLQPQLAWIFRYHSVAETGLMATTLHANRPPRAASYMEEYCRESSHLFFSLPTLLDWVPDRLWRREQ